MKIKKINCLFIFLFIFIILYYSIEIYREYQIKKLYKEIRINLRERNKICEQEFLSCSQRKRE